MSSKSRFDVIVIGGGHAGCEAALASARLGCSTLLLTLNLESIALLPCNPSIGGTGKSQLVREVDALGGQMALCIDQATLQSRTLNTGKGPAVQALRAQADKKLYQQVIKQTLFRQDNLTVRQSEVQDFLVNNNQIIGVRTATGAELYCQAVVVATGVYLKSRIIIGPSHWDAGPQGLQPANYLSASLQNLGFELRRFKTGTPARLDGRSIDFPSLTPQPGDEPIEAFSSMTKEQLYNKMKCYLTWTNEKTHEIIRQNLHLSPMFSGQIKGTGARYCPSIEDKIHRFADKDRHQVFLEPEGIDGIEWYAQGLSSSLPEDVQVRLYRSIKGFEHAQLIRLAYAIEYDCIDSRELTPGFAAKKIRGLYFAGQINGTSGYEEAAAQGLLAGINASQHIKGNPPIHLSRNEAYLGVLADDLSSKGTDEPYRMLTGRAEYRLSLRQDNADLRLTSLGFKIGLVNDERMKKAEQKAKLTQQLLSELDESGVLQQIKRLETDVKSHTANYPADVVKQAEIQIKYEGYLHKEAAQIRAAQAMENCVLPQSIDYLSINALRIEARQKLKFHQPISLGQASRIPGVTPADVAVLSVWLKKHTPKNTLDQQQQ